MTRRPQLHRPWRRLVRPAAALLVATAPGLAPSGLHAQAEADIHLLTLGRDGDRVTVAGPPRAITDRDGYDNQPAFSHDGRAILYTSIRDGQADSYRYDLATGRTTRLTRTAESEYSPTPMPGSSRFSVVRVEADETQRLWSFADDGSDPRLLLPDIAPVGYHAWITARRAALFVLGEPTTLQLADLTGGSATTAADGIGRAIQPVPHRKAVTFTQEIDDEWWLRELDVNTGATRSIAPLLGPDGYHAHTPHGTILAAHGSRIYQLRDADWLEIADLGPFDLGTISRLAVSPDGRHLAVVADRPAGDGAAHR